MREGAEVSGVHSALLEVQLPFEYSQHVVVDRAVRAQPQERLALRVDDGAMDLAMLDDLLVFRSGTRPVALTLDVLRAVLVGLAQPVEQRAVAGPHRVELINPPRGGLDQLLARVGFLLAKLNVRAQRKTPNQP